MCDSTAKALVLIASVVWATACHGETAAWSEPAIDTWSYSNGGSGGTRFFAPSFGTAVLNAERTAFVENGAISPTRLGSMLVAFETSDQVTPSLDPSRYAIQSAQVTARVQSGSTGSLPYSDQPVTPASLFADAQTGGVDSQQPMELFGVGFRSGYAGFALGPDPSGVRFAESTAVYSATDGGYVAYPVVGDGAGAYADVSNNLTGGFSATTGDHHTAPFVATPWATGSAGLTEGATVPNDTTFTFTIDLSQPGVVEYLQQSLASGAVGFFVSTMHPGGQPGAGGGGAYPQWYTKEALALFPNAEAATFVLDVNVLPLPGDYDSDGAVTPADYSVWVSNYGGSVAIPGNGADGNADGVIDAADYSVWRDAYAAPTSAAFAVPEASGAMLALVGLSMGMLCIGKPVQTAYYEANK